MAEDKQSHWQFLANLLGAEPKTPQPKEPSASGTEESSAEAAPPVSGRPTKSERKVPAKSSPPADWQSIASNLGMEVEEPAPSEFSASDETPAGEAQAPEHNAHDSSPILEHQPTNTGTEFPSTLPGFGVQRPPSTPPDTYDESPGEDQLHPAEPDSRVIYDEPVDDEPVDDDLTEEVDFRETAELDDGSEDGDEEEQKPRRRRPRRRRRRSSKEGRESEVVSAESAESDVTDTTDVTEETEETMDKVGYSKPTAHRHDEDQEEAEAGESRRPRRRRRRRRSSAARSDESAQHDDSTDGDRPTSPSSQEGPSRSRRPKRPARDVEERDVA